MKNLIEKLGAEATACNVTLIFNTHRTSPDNQQDSIQYKNLMKEAVQKVKTNCEKPRAEAIEKTLLTLADDLDHNRNADSMLVFVNENFHDLVRLDIPVEDRAIVDRTFAVRDLFKAMHHQQSFYALVLSRDSARVLKAVPGDEIAELEGNFPIENDTLYVDNKLKSSMAGKSEHMIEEFFNRVDKEMQEVLKNEALPIVVCTEERNYHHYMNVTDKKEAIAGHLNKNRMDYTAYEVVKEARKVLSTYLDRKNADRLSELNEAQGKNMLESDLNQVWLAIHEGKGKTVFVAEGFHQPGKLNGTNIEVSENGESNGPDAVADLVDEIITAQIKHGGDVVFADPEAMNGFKGLALVTRY
ncbi:MAG: hypothetical protein ABR572_04960 [Cryomorphaceae bacterium]